MKIAFVQLAPVLGDVRETVRKLNVLLHQCEAADLVVLPELCNSGYNFISHQQAWETSEEIERSTFIQFLETKCRQFDLYLASGFNERDGEALFNSAC